MTGKGRASLTSGTRDTYGYGELPVIITWLFALGGKHIQTSHDTHTNFLLFPFCLKIKCIWHTPVFSSRALYVFVPKEHMNFLTFPVYLKIKCILHTPVFSSRAVSSSLVKIFFYRIFNLSWHFLSGVLYGHALLSITDLSFGYPL